jgi:multidrug efflux pump subunit AcrB
MKDVAPELPAGTIGPFVNDEFGLTAVATIALWSDGFSLEEMRRVTRDVRRQLDALQGSRRSNSSASNRNVSSSRFRMPDWPNWGYLLR